MKNAVLSGGNRCKRVHFLFFFFSLMQLFICSDFQISWNQLTINNNPELFNQLRKVLRAQAGFVFCIQSEMADQRYRVALESWSDKEIQTTILEIIPSPAKKQKVWMLIAFPNKQEKMELIIQKLTEIGIDEIFLWASERSLLKTLNPNKEQRLLKIIKEAAEQSRSWSLPTLTVVNDPQILHQDWEFMVFDLPSNRETSQQVEKSDVALLGVIGPEGGLTERDYLQFPSEIQFSSLWASVLRMETAAIIGAWKLRNCQ